jgi:hypothetical protein
MLLVGRHVFFGVDRIHWAFGDADGAVNAFIWVDGQKVRALTKAIHGANVDAIGVLAFDTSFCNGMCHFWCSAKGVETLYFRSFQSPLIQIGLDGVKGLWDGALVDEYSASSFVRGGIDQNQRAQHP